jgi:hypothetical protein
MNKRHIIASLNNIANELDNSGFYLESNSITKIMTKLAQTNFVKNRFLELHPQIQQEISRLKSAKTGTGQIDISDLYTNNRYWNMPSFIEEKDITSRIKQLQNPDYQKTLAEKRLKFISNKLETERLSETDRQTLLNDVNYLKQFISTQSLSDNPELQIKKPTPQTAYERMQQIEDDELEKLNPKPIDYNQKVYELVFKEMKKAYPKKSDTEIGLSLSNKSNLQGYKDINNNPELRSNIMNAIRIFSSKFMDAEQTYKKLSGIFIDKISFSGVR